MVKRENRERERIVLAAEKAAREKGYGVVVGYANTEEEIAEFAEEMLKKKVAGLLIDSTKWVSAGRLEDATVYINETKEFEDKEKTVVYYRMSEASRMATEQLLNAGHQKIACIFREGDTKLINGYKLALRMQEQKNSRCGFEESKSSEESRNTEFHKC